MDTQQLARNQLDALLAAIESMTGIDYGQRIKELEAQNADLVAALEDALQLCNDIHANGVNWEILGAIATMIEEKLALAQVGE